MTFQFHGGCHADDRKLRAKVTQVPGKASRAVGLCGRSERRSSRGSLTSETPNARGVVKFGGLLTGVSHFPEALLEGDHHQCVGQPHHGLARHPTHPTRALGQSPS